MKPRKQNVPSTPDNERSAHAAPANGSGVNAEDLIHSAHRVLVHYLPGTPLPSELSRVRAMLDKHMFGRDTRTQRDDVVRIARQIDSWSASTGTELSKTYPYRRA